MLDPKLLRNDLDTVATRLAVRNMVLDTAAIVALEEQRKTLQTETEKLQAERNAGSKRIGQAKAKGEDVSAVMAEMHAIGDRLKAKDMIGRVITIDVSLTDSAAGRLATIDRDASQPLGIAVKTKIDGVLRGILHDGLKVAPNAKLADVDPRGEVENCFTVSDKA